jgi:hypothetical protein
MKRKDSFHPNGERYELDFGECSHRKGFAQIDTRQDAWYYGTWANPETLRIVQFAEGDLSVMDFDSPEEFTTYLRETAEYEWFIGIDPMTVPSIEDGFARLGLADLLH